MLTTAEHAQHLRTRSAHANPYEVGIAALVVQDKQQGLVTKRGGTDLHATDFGEAVFDRNGQVARLLCLDKHLGGQLRELRRCHTSEDIPIASMGHDAAI